MKALALGFLFAYCTTHAQQAPPPKDPASTQAKPRAVAAKAPAIAPSNAPHSKPDWSKPVQLEMLPASAPVATEAKSPARLGPIDAWRYRRCQEEAAQAPTVVGVHQGMRLCREKFDQ